MTRRQLLAASAAFAAPPPAIRVESDGMLSIDGARRFILGLYQMPRGADHAQVRAAGFNLVHTTAETLPEAARHGLFGWIAVGSVAGNPDRVRKMVLAAKDSPALLFWETEDEPTFVWQKPKEIRVTPQRIAETHRFVKALDPAHPFYLNHSPTHLESTLRGYNVSSDIVATDVYPVIPPGIRPQFALWPDGRQGDLLNQSISQVGQYADKMRRVAGPARAVFMVLQAFAWEALRKDKQDAAMIRYPTAAETRFMAYQSVVHGVNGVIYWGLAYATPESGMWNAVQAVAGEFSAIAADLAVPALPLALTLEYREAGHSLDRGIEWIARGNVLIAVNADPNPVEVTFAGLGGYRACEPQFDARPATSFSAGRLRDEFPPFSVRVYRLRR